MNRQVGNMWIGNGGGSCHGHLLRKQSFIVFDFVNNVLQVSQSLQTELSKSEVQSFVLQCFTNEGLHRDHKKQVSNNT